MMKKASPAVVFLLLLPLFVSCAARINGVLHTNGQADLTIHASLEPRMSALIGRLAAASGSAQQGGIVLDGPAMAASLSAAPGVASASFANVSPAVIEGPVKITKIGDFLSTNITQGFISFEQGSTGGRCAFTINLDTGPEILNLISPEITEYFAALMAPVATGEILSKAEYLDLVSSVYGRGIADEIANASIQVSFELPGTVQSARGGTFSGRKADFTVPLLDLLVLEIPLNYEITWK
jgi:hypothetical protein